MELSHSGSDSGNVVPLLVNESTVEVEPELYDFSSFLEGDIVDDFFPEFKEILKVASSPSSGHVVPEVVEEVLAEKNIQLVQTPPTPPQRPIPTIVSSPQGSVKWTIELHACFLDAVGQLGGPFVATPKTVRDIMRVEGLSLHQVKSHLQKHRASKLAHSEMKQLHRRGSSFSRVLGGPTKPVASTQAQPSQAKNPSKRRAKPNKQDYGSLHARMEYQKHLQRIFEAQRLHAKIAISRMAAMGGYQSVTNQNMGGYPFASNLKMRAYPQTGTQIYPENSFIREATEAPMVSCFPYQLNQYPASTSAAATYAGISIAERPDKLPDITEAHPRQATQASIRDKAVPGSSEQGLISASGENNEIPGISDEEFIASFLVDFDEITGEAEKSQ